MHKKDGIKEDFRVSLSVSPFTESLLKEGIVFQEGERFASSAVELQRLFIEHGANEVYARIATSRNYRANDGDHSVSRGLERAALAKALGLPFNPEIGLFPVYGDFMGQPAPDFSEYPELELPDVWSSLTLEQMLPILRKYGTLIAREIIETGVQVRIWDLGNEVDFGVAGVAIYPDAIRSQASYDQYQPPDLIDKAIGQMTSTQLWMMSETDRIAWLRTHLWPYMAQVFSAVADGIRAVDPDARFSTHLSAMAATQGAFTLAFFQTMREGGFFPDELGLSYYPTIPGISPTKPVPEAFKETVTLLNKEFGRPVFIAEFGYPAGHLVGNFKWNAEVENYPQNAAGQAAFLQDLTSWGASTGLLSGIRPWGPDYALAGWEPMALFSVEGKNAVARPGLAAIAQALAELKVIG